MISLMYNTFSKSILQFLNTSNNKRNANPRIKNIYSECPHNLGNFDGEAKSQIILKYNELSDCPVGNSPIVNHSGQLEKLTGTKKTKYITKSLAIAKSNDLITYVQTLISNDVPLEQALFIKDSYIVIFISDNLYSISK